MGSFVLGSNIQADTNGNYVSDTSNKVVGKDNIVVGKLNDVTGKVNEVFSN